MKPITSHRVSGLTIDHLDYPIHHRALIRTRKAKLSYGTTLKGERVAYWGNKVVEHEYKIIGHTTLQGKEWIGAATIPLLLVKKAS